jgi:CRISPR-associated protein Cmr4
MPLPILLGLIAETSIHYGAETGGGAIDLPVAREAATHYPVISGSAFKGSFKDVLGKDSIYTGTTDAAGQLMFSDIRLLLLPLRSLSGSYAWATCPLLLERLQRDMERAQAPETFDWTDVDDGTYIGPAKMPALLQLEERQFAKAPASNTPGLLSAIGKLIVHAGARARVESQLVVLSNNNFAWFAQFALPVNAHNKLDDNKISENLWYEETLPPDTVMYGLILPRPTLLEDQQRDAIKAVKTRLASDKPYLQIGAGETTGLGWFAHNCRTAQQEVA